MANWEMGVIMLYACRPTISAGVGPYYSMASGWPGPYHSIGSLLVYAVEGALLISTGPYYPNGQK